MCVAFRGMQGQMCAFLFCWSFVISCPSLGDETVICFHDVTQRYDTRVLTRSFMRYNDYLKQVVVGILYMYFLTMEDVTPYLLPLLQTNDEYHPSLFL
jgi:hypothetical protein